MTIYQNVTQLTGRTPLVRLNRLVPAGGAEVLAKLEFFNPTHSVKDRIAVAMVDAAEKQGLLSPESIILEATSGNTGIGLAFTASARGYKSAIVMPETVSMERKLLLRALGAELILTPGAEGMTGAMETALKMRAQDGRYWLADQFNNPANVDAHRRTTAEEIWRDTEGKVDILVAGVGTGGTITGAGSRLREYNPRCASSRWNQPPRQSSPAAKKVRTLQGKLARASSPPSWTSACWMKLSRWKPKTLSKLPGKWRPWKASRSVSPPGAAVWAALLAASRPENAGKRMVVIIPSFAERYLSTNLFATIREELNAGR